MSHLAVKDLRDQAARDFGYPSPPEDFRYDRVEMPLPDRPDPLDAEPYYATRAVPEPGELWFSSKTWPIKPLTLDNDARSMPYQYNINPSLPIRDFSRQFPHTWIDYDKMYAAVYPDEPPMPSGYAPAPYARNEERRAIDEAMPHPWSSEEDMTHDISGFGYSGMGQYPLISLDVSELFSSPTTTATEDAVKKEADEAKAAGSTEQLIGGIINFGSQVGALYLQKRALDEAMKEAARQRASQLEIERLRFEQQRLALQAARSGAGSEVVDDMKPSDGGVSPWLVGGGAIAATVAATQLL